MSALTPFQGSAHCRSTVSVSSSSTLIPKVSSLAGAGVEVQAVVGFATVSASSCGGQPARVAECRRFPGGDVVAFAVEEVVVAGRRVGR